MSFTMSGNMRLGSSNAALRTSKRTSARAGVRRSVGAVKVVAEKVVGIDLGTTNSAVRLT